MHECSHLLVVPYEDETFDEFHPNFTQHEQHIPSPDGMPAFEVVDLENPTYFFSSYETFESCTLPDFTGDRVRAYVSLRDLAVGVRSLSRSSPA